MNCFDADFTLDDVWPLLVLRLQLVLDPPTTSYSSPRCLQSLEAVLQISPAGHTSKALLRRHLSDSV